MTDRKALPDQNDTPEDVATLYSWANLHGAKYRDFSASRAQTREKARQRVQDAIDSEHDRAQAQDEGVKAVEAIRQAEAARAADAVARQAEAAALQAAEQSAQLALQQAAQQRANMNPPPQFNWQQPRAERFAALAASGPAPLAPPIPSQFENPAFAQGQAFNRVPPPANEEAVKRDVTLSQSRAAWSPAEPREAMSRPAWLASDRADMAGQKVPQAPEDTLQGSRDRLTSRWFALKGVFESPNAPQVEAAPVAPVSSRAPVLAVFSLAGGVGKTSLVATLGRALSARGEKVLLVDTAAYGLLPFYFGARDQRPGVLRTFAPPGTGSDAPIQMVTIDTETLGPETAGQEPLSQEISRDSRGVGRVIVDLATASGATTRRILRMSPTVLVPVVPDMSSVVSVGSIDAFFQRNSSASGGQVLPYYVLNQFDPSLPLHLDVREVLREQLGDRLLPFALRRAPAVSEALAEGMTVVDYAPNSTVAEDFSSLAGWVKNVAAPAVTSYRGVRWSER